MAHHLGAADVAGARLAQRVGLGFGSALAAGIAACFVLGAGGVGRIFSSDPAVWALSQQVARARARATPGHTRLGQKPHRTAEFFVRSTAVRCLWRRSPACGAALAAGSRARARAGPRCRPWLASGTRFSPSSTSPWPRSRPRSPRI